MTRTPDEIKKGLECCMDHDGTCEDCPYVDGECRAFEQLAEDSLALIQQKEKENAEQAERIRQLEQSLSFARDLADGLKAATVKQEQELYVSVERNRQLEADLEDMTARYKIADECAKKKGEMNEKLYAELTAVKAERDAALADFKLYRERNIKGECGVYACDLCKRGGRYEDWDEIKCPTGCSGVSHWEWRGVQKEE